MAGRLPPRPGLRRKVLLRRPHDRRLLPAELRVAGGQARERLVLFVRRGGGAGGVPRLQALPARQAWRARSKGGGGQAGVRTDRGGGRSAQARPARGEGGHEPVPFPSRVQESHRRDAEGLCRADAGAPRGRRLAHGGDDHRGDLRRRVQLFEPLLRERCGAARHDAERDPARGERRGDPLRRSARRRLARCWWPRPTKACARSCSATIPTSWRASFRIASLAPSSWAAIPSSSAWSRKSSGWWRRPVRASDLPLDIRGTAFQERVWQALRAIPPGRTATYAEIARAVGRPKAARAVAQACAANPLAIAIPCHRVVRTDGDLSGYRWGVERKRELIAREAA